jgi:membrane protein
MNAQTAFELLKQTFSEWQEDKASRLAAALAYYTDFSIVPLLLIAIAIAGFFFGDEAARGQVVDQAQGLFGQEGAATLETAIENANKPTTGLLATIIGIGAMILGATGFFGELKGSLNTIWEVEPKPGGGVWAMIKDRFLSFTMVLGIGFLLLTSLVLSAALSGLSGFFEAAMPGSSLLAQAVNFVVSFGVITLLFAMIYKILPDVIIAWRDVWLGAAITALLFTIGKWAIGIYLGHASLGSTYGAAGSLLVVLAWVYYSAQILFFGAEFTQVYANKYGSRLTPEENAVAITDEARAQQGMPRKETVEQAARSEMAEQREPTPADHRSGAHSTGGRLNVVRVGALVLVGVMALFGRVDRRDTNRQA